MVTFSVAVDRVGEKLNHQGSTSRNLQYNFTRDERLQHIGTLFKSTATRKKIQLRQHSFRQNSYFKPKKNQIDDWISKRLLNPR